jgi:putative membrane protein
MRGFLARVLISAFGLWIADLVLAGVRFDGASSLFLAALLLGFVNAIVRPIVVVLTLPITLLSLGLFIFVINGAMLLLVARLMPSFHLEGLGTAIVAWVIVGLTNWVANGFIGHRGRVAVIRR